MQYSVQMDFFGTTLSDSKYDGRTKKSMFDVWLSLSPSGFIVTNLAFNLPFSSETKNKPKTNLPLGKRISFDISCFLVCKANI